MSGQGVWKNLEGFKKKMMGPMSLFRLLPYLSGRLHSEIIPRNYLIQKAK